MKQYQRQLQAIVTLSYSNNKSLKIITETTATDLSNQ